jgi:UDP-N-acetylmuramoylalanine--D-glutamate ligase
LNVACAIKAARALKIEVPVIKKAVEDFSPIEGRLQLLREYKGIKIYNDNNSTTPEATVAALKALGKRGDKGVILIMGGSDKSLDMSALLELIPLYCKTIILLPGTGTDQVKSALKLEPVLDLKEAIENALLVAERGDSILFSPAFASFGLFKNEYDRGAQYIKLINLL